MPQALIRHLRLFCASPNVPPVRQQDGVLAVAGVLERAGLARLLLVDMERWGRNPGASVTNAVDQLAPAAHRYLIGGFGIALSDTLIVEWDGSGAFDLLCGFGDGSGTSHRPLCGADRGARPRSREAFVAATGAMGRAMLQRPRRWARASGRGSRDEPARSVRDVRALVEARRLHPAGGRRMRLARRARRTATVRRAGNAAARARAARSPGPVLPRASGGQCG